LGTNFPLQGDKTAIPAIINQPISFFADPEVSLVLSLFRACLLLAGMALFWFFPQCAAWSSPLPDGVRQVLVLYSYHPGQAWTDSVMRGMKEFLSGVDYDIRLHVEYLDTKRNPDPAYLEQFDALLRRKLTGLNFDLLLVSDNDALNLALRYRDELFPRAPIVFCGVNNFEPAMLGGRDRITGVVEVHSYRETLELALKLHPETREIIVVGRDDTLTEQLIMTTLADVIRQFGERVRGAFWNNIPAEELQQRLPKLRRGQIVMLATTLRDRSGQVFSYGESCRLTRSACSVPVYGGWDFMLGKGIVGGRLVSGLRQGQLAARMAVSILRGENPDAIPVIDSASNTFMFDDRELRRFGIPAARLPEGSVIINQPPSFYSVNKREFWLFLGLMLALLVVTLLLLRGNYRQKLARRALKTALKEAQGERDQITAILRSMTDPLLVIDPAGRIARMNPSAEALFNVRFEAVAGREARHLIEDEAFSDLLETALRKNGESLSVDFALHHPEYGEIRTFQTRFFAVPSPDEKRAGLVALLQDVTRGREMDRMKSEFISTAAHELRTPITVILGFAELLASDRRFSSEEREEFLRTIVTKAEELARLVEELLDLSRLELGGMMALNIAPCVIDDLVSPLVEQYRNIHRGHQFFTQLPSRPIYLAVDQGKIGQVLENLLSNAVKYSPQGGPVTVAVVCDESHCRVGVTDQGIGMTPRQAARMFDKFYRADATNTAIGGLGLGMAIARGIVEAHGGQIRVESIVGQGTTVEFSLPRADRA
jgi:PAS domain S-box-containing protein